MNDCWEERRLQHQVELEQALRKAVELLAALPEVRKVIIFGSYARRRRDLFTDLDLVVIMDSEEDFLGRLARLYGRLGGRP
ncbi:MAG: nucleotidyltransferase domain-containing protein [Candidatus Acetothermia bacterium]|nr:nucleotidyltransferase domain-containing protein [Candidatus Acetothermia bacterium]